MRGVFLGGLALAIPMLCAPGHAAPPDAKVTYVITNGGVDVKGDGQVHFVVHGNHDGPTVTWDASGVASTLPQGVYDVHVTFSDGAAQKDFWIDNQSFAGAVTKKVEINLPLTDVVYVITNGGKDAKDKGTVHYALHATNHASEMTWAPSGGTTRLPAGVYDVHVEWTDGSANKDFWIDNQAFKGKVSKSVEIGVPVTDVRYVITNNGADTKDQGTVHYALHASNHANEITWARSGDTTRLAAGIYDVHVEWSDGSANKDFWIDNQDFTGAVSKSVEIGMNVANVSYVVTNGGVDTKDKGTVHYAPHASNHAGEITWARSGDTTRLPVGVYDVHVEWSDGSAAKDFWIDNQDFTGTVSKSVEIGMPVADVTYVLENLGQDLKDKAQVHYALPGKHDGGVTWAISGGMVRLAAGAFDVHLTYEDGLINKSVWLDNQSFSGTATKTFDFKVVSAQPTVSVTENGKDVGNQAVVDYLDPTDQTDFGTVKSSETALVEQGPYDIHAWLGTADGWLRKQAVSGKPHYTIAIAAPVTATLTAGAPPPKACAIEVYGVNFDFNKATLRPDSEPMLKQVLALFTATPAFAAEVSGHTDNIGTVDYNMKLSDARAAAVKAWLVAHGVQAARVSSRGYGDTRPLVPNDNDQDRFKNRRVELRRTNCK